MAAAQSNNSWQVGRGILILASVTYGVLPAIIDSQDAEHLPNPAWPPHAKLHLLWLIAAGFYLSLYSIYLFWTASPADSTRIRTGVVIGACQVGGFYTAGVFRKRAGAAFDAGDRVLFGFLPPALLHFITSGCLLLIGYLLTEQAGRSPKSLEEGRGQ